MKLIKCDMCGKESTMNMIQDYIGFKSIDLCVECNRKYRQAKDEFDIEDKKLIVEYEKKTSIFNNYKKTRLERYY